jgi:hypothetical protein
VYVVVVVFVVVVWELEDYRDVERRKKKEEHVGLLP